MSPSCKNKYYNNKIKMGAIWKKKTTKKRRIIAPFFQQKKWPRMEAKARHSKNYIRWMLRVFKIHSTDNHLPPAHQPAPPTLEGFRFFVCRFKEKSLKEQNLTSTKNTYFKTKKTRANTQQKKSTTKQLISTRSLSHHPSDKLFFFGGGGLPIYIYKVSFLVNNPFWRTSNCSRTITQKYVKK